jgi:hypothetical protein
MGDSGRDPGEETRVPGSGELAAKRRATKIQPLPATRPVLGLVAVYSDLAVETTLPGSLGRIYPLREGEVLFVGKPHVGKPPQPGEEFVLDDGRRLTIAHVHLFPRTDEFEYVSKKHLAIEMRPGGEVRLMDFSTNGSFLMKRREHVLRTGQSMATYTFRGEETVVLGIDLRVLRDRKARDRATRHQLQIFPFESVPSDSSNSSMETQP